MSRRPPPPIVYYPCGDTGRQMYQVLIRHLRTRPERCPGAYVTPLPGEGPDAIGPFGSYGAAIGWAEARAEGRV